MRVERLVWLSLLCLNLSLAQLLHGSASRRPLIPKEATRAMLQLMPNEKGFLTKLRVLVKAGADVSATNRQGMTILHRTALFGGNSAAAKFIIDSAGDTPIPNTFRGSPLYLAIYSDNVGVARVLMDKDVDPNFFDSNDKTPLLYALEHESHKVAKFLINKGASLDITNKTGHTPLHLVKDKGLAELILAKGGDPDAQDKLGMTPLHYAADFDNLPVAKLLASASKDVNIKGGNDEVTPLHYVRSTELAETILKKGGDPNSQANNGQTPLHWVKNKHIIRLFVMHGGDLNAEDSYGRTPIDYAATKEFFQSLILFGAELEKSYAYRHKYDKNNFSNKTEKEVKQGDKNNNRQKHPTSDMYNDTERSRSEEAKNSNQPDFLTNLNELARGKDSNPIIGRKQELSQVSNALRRKGMRGTVLVGDAGVGKTALVEGLAYLLANGELPELAGREIYALNVGSMWGHPDNRYVGQLQKRVNEALEFIAAEPDKRILFIDEIHQLLGGGQVSTSGSPPITDILKSHLGRGDIQLIGATTHDEYQRIVEGDRAIVDRLLRIDIDEPSAEETLTILRGIKAGYEQHHGITVNDTALKAAVNLSRRYLAAQQQPRNAINLLDEAAAAMPYDAKRLTKRHIANIVAEKVGIQIATILKSRNEKAEELLPALQKEIYGQDHALEEIDSSLSIAFADLSDNTRPLATLLFAGITGVGKTETAKVIAQHLFDSKDNLTAVDMSGYKHPTSNNDTSTSSSNKNYGNYASSNNNKKHKQPDYLSNLTEEVLTKAKSPFIGRERELEQVVNSLRRKGMRGTVLVGDPGVGKTAIVEALAHKLAKGELPELAGREIFALDVGTMWGHEKNQYVGQLHKRVNDALKFIAAEPEKRILFIDEIHQLLSGRYVSTSGSPPITDVFKPFLGRDMQLIGLTTHDEYQRIIEGDRAIVDRLLRIDIDEPSDEDTLAILRGIKESHEKHHDIAISDTTLQAVLNLSNRYMASQQQPRKSITLLDEAASALPHDAKRLFKKHIATIIAKKIGIEVATILKSKNEKAAELLPALQEQIYGQDHALEAVNSSLTIAFAGLADATKPMAVFLFAGTTGVGKTETAKVIAKKLFDSEDNFITADMSSYKQPASVAALTERLTRGVKAKPYSVILLDEVEKANKEVQHLLLQLLDEGRLIDNRQRKVDFTNAIIVLTTNSTNIEKDFVPELLNRLNKRITYDKLSPDVSMRLVQKQLDLLNHNLREDKITVSLSQATKRIIAEEGYSQAYGAREMTRVFEQVITYPLSDGINRGIVPSKQNYRIDLRRTGNKQVKATLMLDDKVLLELPISIQTLSKKTESYRGIN